MKNEEQSFATIVYNNNKKDFSLNDILEKVHKSEPKIHLILILDNEKDIQTHALARYQYIHLISKEDFLKNFNQILGNLLKNESNSEEENQRFRHVEIDTLKFVDGLENDVYIKNKATGQMSALFRKGSILSQEEIDNYKRRGITHVYIEKETIKEVMKQIDGQRAFFASFSGFKFVLRGEDDPLSKRFERKILRFQDELLIDGEFQEQIESSIDKTIQFIGTKPKLESLLKQASSAKRKDRYLTEHMLLLCYLTGNWANRLGWHSKGTKDKLVFASILHDITLAGFPELSLISDMNEFNQKKSALSQKEQEIFVAHPEEAAKLVNAYFSLAPQDTADIIIQHHEKPDGSGFPKGINFTKMSPLAMLFILAHDFVENFLKQDEYKTEDFFKEAMEKYPQGVMRRMIQTIMGGI